MQTRTQTVGTEQKRRETTFMQIVPFSLTTSWLALLRMRSAFLWYCMCLCLCLCAEKPAHVCACLCCCGLWHNVNAAKMNAVTFIECAERERKKMPKAATWPSKACTIFCDCFEMIKMPFQIEQVATIEKCAAHFSNFLGIKIQFSLEFFAFVFLSRSIDVFFFQFSFVYKKKNNNKKMENFKWTCMEVDTQENIL